MFFSYCIGCVFGECNGIDFICKNKKNKIAITHWQVDLIDSKVMKHCIENKNKKRS
jgi:hypothetical protein